jgi:hypothetical protein
VDINLVLSEKELLALQKLFYSTIPEERLPGRDPSLDGLDMDRRIPSDELRALWVKIDDQWEQQHPFSVL